MRIHGKWVLIGLGFGLVGVGMDYLFRRHLSDEQQIWAFVATTVIAMFTVHAINKRRNSSKIQKN
ncbi:MAG: hypothetical protein ACKOC9_05060 [Alphaproteobacteria bacterium]|jgi:hypothetical protein